MIRLGQTKEHLPCTLGELEVQERREQLVEESKKREQRELTLARYLDSVKLEKKAHEADVAAAANECSRLVRAIQTRSEYRDVEVFQMLDKTQVLYVRTDTGDVVRTRAATEGELQRALPLEDDIEAAEAEADPS